MSRLKHPIRSLKEPFGKAGLTVAILALVMALVGGAYAAGGLTKSQEKQVTKIAKKYAGKAGPAGAAGATGPAGPAGSAGTNGKNGKDGGEGPEGSPWTAGGTLPSGQTETGSWTYEFAGESPQWETTPEQAAIAVSFPIPLAAELDGAHVHFVPFTPNATGTGDLTENSSTITNLTIATGAFDKGQEISGEGIPSGATITACSPKCGGSHATELEISAEATETVTGVSLTAKPPAACPGTAAVPKALSGNLCMYGGGNGTSQETQEALIFRKPGALAVGAGKTGSFLVMHYSPAGFAQNDLMYGTWAVTAP